MKQARRFFLGTTIATAASSPFLFAKDDPAAGGKTRFAFISDMHYAHVGELADGGTSWGLTESGLVELVDYLQKQELDFVMLGGDFCNTDDWFTDASMVEDAHKAYRRVAAEFKRLDIPVYYLRGNHEGFRALVDGVPDRSHEFYGDKLYRHHCGYGEGKAAYYDFERSGWKFIVLDSGAMIASVEPPQMRWLESVLESTDASTPIALFIHGPLHSFFGDSPESTKLVANYSEVLNRFKDHSLKMVYQGHLHKTKIEEVSRTDSSGNTRKTHFMLTGAAFMAVTSPNHADGGFHIIDIEGNNFSIGEVKGLSRPPVRIWPSL